MASNLETVAQTVLITGVSGFIAKHAARAFLAAGYRVRGTVRDRRWVDPVRAALGALADSGAALEFCEADLLADAGWDAATAGCDAIIHVACPDPVVQPKNENDLIQPAVDGTLRVLRSATRNDVPRFVYTSSIFAVMLGHPKDRTDYDASAWSDLSDRHLTPYARAKTLGERAARDFVAEADGMQFVSINPGFVFGPALDRRLNSSTEMIRMFLAGRYPRAPRLNIPAVDVRDVADLHVVAAEQAPAAPDRLLAVAGSPWMIEITRAIRKRFGPVARRCPDKEMADWIVRPIAMVDRAARSVLHQLGREYRIDADTARVALDREFVPPLESALATVESLIDRALVTP